MGRRALDGQLQPMSTLIATAAMEVLERWLADESRARLRCCVCLEIPERHFRTMKRSGVEFEACCAGISCKGCAQRTVWNRSCPVCKQNVFEIVDPFLSPDIFERAEFRCCGWLGNRSGLAEHARDNHDEVRNMIVDIASVE